jgi:hypothetical protein
VGWLIWVQTGAVVAGLLSTIRPRTRVHWSLGAVYLAGLVVVLAGLPDAEGRNWLVFMATLIAVGLNVIGVGMLLARRHPHRVHRHIVYTGYGVVFAIVAVCWQLAVRYPRHDAAATVVSIAAYVLGSVAILAYKSYQTGPRAQVTRH